MSSAAKCCASAAEPPLPQASPLPPARRAAASSVAPRVIGATSDREASSLSCALSANCALTRAESAASALSIGSDFTPSLYEHFDLDAPRRVGMRRESADARLHALAAVQAPGERRVFAPWYIAQLASAPRHRNGVGVVRVVGLAQ